jgi:hypothetical protein
MTKLYRAYLQYTSCEKNFKIFIWIALVVSPYQYILTQLSRKECNIFLRSLLVILCIGYHNL